MPDPKPKRGRPASIDTETAMQSVVELFRSKGFAAVSLDDLSEATGLSRPSLYRAFGNKLSMYIGAMDAFGADVAREAAPKVFEAETLEGGIRDFLDAMLEIYYRDSAIAPGCLVYATAPSVADEAMVRQRLHFGIEQTEALMCSRIAKDSPEASETRIQTAVEIATNTLIAYSARAKSGAPKAALSDMGARTAKAIMAVLAAD